MAVTRHGHDVRLIRRYTSGGRVSSRPHDVQFGKPGPALSLRQLQGSWTPFSGVIRPTVTAACGRIRAVGTAQVLSPVV